jgi:SAM-dependent methyltransferase
MNPAEFANIANCERDFRWSRGTREILFRLLDRHLTGRPMARALEAGCGTGFFSWLLRNQRHYPVVPMDTNANGLRYTRAMGVERAVQGDTASIPFAGRAFDLVFSIDMPAHLFASSAFDLVFSIDMPAHLTRGSETDAASEMARVLARGGLIVMRTSALDIRRSRHSAFAYERQRFTRRRLRELFEAAGFRVLRCTYANSLSMPVALAKFRLWEPLQKGPVTTGVQHVAPWLDRLLCVPLAIESAWIGAGVNFPAGQSLLLIGEKMN